MRGQAIIKCSKGTLRRKFQGIDRGYTLLLLLAAATLTGPSEPEDNDDDGAEDEEDDHTYSTDDHTIGVQIWEVRRNKVDCYHIYGLVQ